MCPRGNRFILLCAAIVAAIPIAPAAWAGDFGTVSGQLVDSLTGQPIAFAFVTLVELNLQTITDADGRFTLSGVPVGSYTLMVTPGDGRLAWSLPVSVAADKVTRLALRAKSKAVPKPEVAPNYRLQAPSAEMTQKSLAAPQLREFRGRQLRSSPSVSRLQHRGICAHQ